MDDEQRLFRSEWLPLLLRTDSERTRAQLRELAEAGSEGQRLIEDYFEKRPADLDVETLDLVLRHPGKRVPGAYGSDNDQGPAVAALPATVFGSDVPSLRTSAPE